MVKSMDGRGEGGRENRDYLTKQLITCLGNKRGLLSFIGQGVRRVRERLGKTRLSILDAFSGSGVVSRFFKQHAELLIVNDLESYAALINGCYLSNRGDLSRGLEKTYDELMYNLEQHGGEGPPERGMIRELYAPADENNIGPRDRVFYTIRNAMYIDRARRLIAELPQGEQKYFIAPLLSEASIHANTSGVFKGFYKNRETGIGQFGGKNQNALLRIKGDIRLPFPVFSNYDTEVLICHGDANHVIGGLPEVDIAYLDPPYNQHPYGSNYFMLNLIADYQYPKNISVVSGIPENWNRSCYNQGHRALSALSSLVERVRAKYVLISFNSEGFIGPEEMQGMLKRLGSVEVMERTYNTFRGSRNLGHRTLYVKEYLYILKKN
jgi:adenine-specific DNA-methyltransferase